MPLLTILVEDSATIRESLIPAMMEFAARHKVEPITEFFPMSKVNEAFERLKSGKARYRIVLENDLA